MSGSNLPAPPPREGVIIDPRSPLPEPTGPDHAAKAAYRAGHWRGFKEGTKAAATLARLSVPAGVDAGYDAGYQDGFEAAKAIYGGGHG